MEQTLIFHSGSGFTMSSRGLDNILVESRFDDEEDIGHARIEFGVGRSSYVYYGKDGDAGELASSEDVEYWDNIFTLLACEMRVAWIAAVRGEHPTCSFDLDAAEDRIISSIRNPTIVDRRTRTT